MRRTILFGLASTLILIQALSFSQYATAAAMAHGRFNDVNAPAFLYPGQRFVVTATAVNDGDATGWFEICVLRVDPPTNTYFPSERDETRKEIASHCSKTLPVLPGNTMTFNSEVFLMQSVPSVTFQILLLVQQDEPIAVGEEEEIINRTVDDFREVVVVNPLWSE